MNFRVSSRRSCSWPAESLSCSAAWVWSSWTGSTMLPVRAMVTKRQTVSDRRVTGRVCSAALLLSSPSLFLFTLLQPQTKIDKPCSSSSSEQRTYIPFWENVLNSVQYAVRPQRWCFILYFCCHDMFFFYIYITFCFSNPGLSDTDRETDLSAQYLTTQRLSAQYLTTRNQNPKLS